MDGFFPERFLGEIFWDEAPADQSDPVQYTELPRIGFEQESLHIGSNSQNSKDEPPPAAYQSDFPQYRDLPRIGFEQESLHNGSNSHNSKDEPLPPANQNDILQYSDLPRIGLGQESSGSGSNSCSGNMNQSDFVQWPAEKTNIAEYERERGFRHMINERMRRQRQRQCCLALHSILPNGTKSDINSVIQMAAKEIQRLQGCRDELQGQNFVLEANLKPGDSRKIQFGVANPVSGIDSMLEALKCLRGLGANTRSITSNFSTEELFAMLEIEAKIADEEVERAIEGTMDEVEWKLRYNVREVAKRQRT